MNERTQHVLYWGGISLPTVVTVALVLALYGFIRERQLPAPTGPYPVGRATYDWTDFGGPAVVIWYPAEQPKKDSVADYLPGIFADQALKGRGPFSQRLGFVKDRAYPAGTLRNLKPPLPLVVWSPEWGLQPTHYAVLAEQLASRGYVVIGSSPADSTGPHERAARVAARVGELDSFMVRLNRLKAAEVGLFQRLATNRVALVGHGVGGEAAVRACAASPNCAAAVDLDGELPAGVGSPKPVLFVAGGGTALPDDPRAFPHAVGVRVHGLAHPNFTDEAVFFQPLAWLKRLAGRVEGWTGLRIVAAYTATFLDQQLRGAGVRWLPQPQGPYDQAKLEFAR